MDIATALLWTLRILLPIVLFCVYFKLQASKENHADNGLTGNVHSKARLLARRQEVVGQPAPASIETMAMKSAQEAPHLFAGTRSRGGRRGGDDTRNAKKEKSEKTEAGQPQEDEADPKIEPVDPAATALQEKMHLESLLNYVAFNRPEQQRVFLPAMNGMPPPPPPPPKKKPADDSTKEKQSGSIAEKANSDAQMVLQGALGVKRSDVALHLHEKLCRAEVEVSESTFELMIEVCLAAEDLKGASQWLMKMETAGHLPKSHVLDKVMNLYSETRTARENEELAKAEAHQEIPLELCEAVVAGEDKGARSKLSSTAPCFVPSFGPAAPSEDEPAAKSSEATPEGGEGEAAESTDAPTASAQPSAPRTKLSASSASFEPQFKVVFVPGPSKFPAWPGSEMIPAGGLPPGPVNMGKGGFDGFGMSKGSGFDFDGAIFDGAKGSSFDFEGKGRGFEKGKEIAKGLGFEKGFEKGKNGGFSEKGFDNWHEKGENGRGKDKGKGDRSEKGKGRGKKDGKGWDDETSWDEYNNYEQGKGWNDSNGKGWSEANGMTSKNDWSSDANRSTEKGWSKDSSWKWSADTSWDFESKWKDNNPKKVWREKQPKDTETDQAEGNSSQGHKYQTKTWRPKAESAVKADDESKEAERTQDDNKATENSQAE